MVAGTPPVLPPGYMSLFQAIDFVDPGALQKGNDQARKDADRFLDGMDWVAGKQHGPPDVPRPVYEEICRRVRRRNAFDRVRDLCAWRTVPSRLLPDDFSRSLPIPPANWLDERLSMDMSSTGRTTIGDRPTRVSGWVMIDAAAFRAATVLAVTSIPKHVSTQQKARSGRGGDSEKRGGRPANPRWEHARPEAENWLRDNGVPVAGDGQQAVLEKHILDWLSKREEHPSSASVARYVRQWIEAYKPDGDALLL